MTAAQSAEAQARLTASLREIVSFLEDAGVLPHSVELLNDYINKHLHAEFLYLAESYGKCNAFLDHDALLNMVYTSWCLFSDGYLIEKKITTKRIKMLKEDKKTDPEVLAKQENLLVELEQKRANVLISVIRIKNMLTIPLSEFRADPNFNYMEKHRANLDRKKYLLSAGKTNKL